MNGTKTGQFKIVTPTTANALAISVSSMKSPVDGNVSTNAPITVFSVNPSVSNAFV